MQYQQNYADLNSAMYDENSRIDKAKKILALLTDYFSQKKLPELSVLDIGCSTGIMDSYLSSHFKKFIGVDIDKKAIRFAQQKYGSKKLKFIVGDSLSLPFPAASFDLVICNHVYEHVSDSQKLFSEILKVLKPGGVCYLAAVNKYWIIEPHYGLPFLSFLPKKLGDYYLQLFQGKDYYENLKSWSALQQEVRKFTVVDYTSKILSRPTYYKHTHPSTPFFLAEVLKYFSPTFFWILEKKKK